MLAPALTLVVFSTTRSVMCGAAGTRPRESGGNVVVVTSVDLEEAVGVWLQEASARAAPAMKATFSHVILKVPISSACPSVRQPVVLGAVTQHHARGIHFVDNDESCVLQAATGKVGRPWCPPPGDQGHPGTRRA
jgi:hypothetical protein